MLNITIINMNKLILLPIVIIVSFYALVTFSYVSKSNWQNNCNLDRKSGIIRNQYSNLIVSASSHKQYKKNYFNYLLSDTKSSQEIKAYKDNNSNKHISLKQIVRGIPYYLKRLSDTNLLLSIFQQIKLKKLFRKIKSSRPVKYTLSIIFYFLIGISKPKVSFANSYISSSNSIVQVTTSRKSNNRNDNKNLLLSSPYIDTTNRVIDGLSVEKPVLVREIGYRKKVKPSALEAAVNAVEKETAAAIEAAVQEVEKETVEEVQRSWKLLSESLQGAKLDSLILLIATSSVIPLFKKLNTSPIIGFMLTGTLLGPSGLNWVKDLHMIDVLGELGIVFFLFEMGLELSLERLKAMRKDVFGLGSSQFFLTAAAGTAVALTSGLSPAAAITIGGSLSLSSSAFVLQLLKDKEAMGTRHGKASFGILLLQDLAVVPLLVIVELLARGGAGLGKALSIAGVKALVTLSAMSFIGKRILNPIFSNVAKSRSQEAFLSIILTTVLLMSFVTKGIGLSDTLGAFLAGLLLSETSYRYQIEADIAPFRGLLLGFFFITVGFSIDLPLIVSEAPKVLLMLLSLILGKASIITLLSRAFGIPLSTSIQTGLLNAQGGEFSFVAFGIAERLGLISPKLCKLLLTTVALSMALTPFLGEIGDSIAKKSEDEKSEESMETMTGDDNDIVDKLQSNDFLFICGYGRVGKMVCDMLDKQFVKYVVLDSNHQKALEARKKGLPVYFGDVSRPDVLKKFNVGSAKSCVITIDDMSSTNKAVVNIKKLYPNLPIVARAKNNQHKKRLESMFDNIYAMSPVLAEDSVLLTLPFGGAVLQKIGVSRPEIDAILEDFRKLYMEEDGLEGQEGEQINSLDLFRRRLPPSTPCDNDDSDHEDDINNNNSRSSSHSENTEEVGMVSKSKSIDNSFVRSDNNTFVTNLSDNRTVVNDDLVQQALKFWYDND